MKYYHARHSFDCVNSSIQLRDFISSEGVENVLVVGKLRTITINMAAAAVSLNAPVIKAGVFLSIDGEDYIANTDKTSKIGSSNNMISGCWVGASLKCNKDVVAPTIEIKFFDDMLGGMISAARDIVVVIGLDE